MTVLLAFCTGIIAGLCLPFVLSLLRDLFQPKELYDNDDVMLNMFVASEWHNMGYWKDIDPVKGADGRTFALASTELARRVANARQLPPRPSIIEVGFGSGDSLKYWLASLQPSRLYGITSVKHQFEAAARKVADRDDCHIILGDAVNDLRGLTDEPVDVVFAVDCVYHFRTRREFLKAAHDKLKSGTGQLSMTDIILPSRPLSRLDRLLVRLVALGAGIPFANLIDADTYEAHLREAGFDDIEIDDISAHVFGPLASYIDGQDARLGHVLNPKKWKRLTTFAGLLRWLDGYGDAEKRRLTFVTVRARASK